MKQIARRSLGIFLSLMMLLTAIPSAFALESDIKGHWAEEALQSFVDDGYLAGDGKGHYTPNATMTRAQFATILNRLTGLTEESATISNCTDVSESDWYYHELAKALAAGFMSGTSATAMSPNAPITRQQAFTMLARYLNLDTSDTSALASFADQDTVADYAKGPVAAMVTAGYVQGSGDGKILPAKQLTRAEGVTVLYRAKTALQAVTPSVTVGYKDGVYIGTGAGYGGTVKVQMTVSGGKITNLEVLSHSDTSGYFNRAKKLLDTVLDKQGTDGVDTVSGATKSSNGLLTAINACISQAQGGADTSKTGSTGSGGGGAGASTKPEGEDFSGALKDGSYTGSARGYSGTTQVTVTVSGGKITAIAVDSHGDTSSYFNSAKGVISKMIEKQSTDVDAVSGATYSSWGIINAVADALKDAVPTGEKTYQVSSWKELTAALGKAKDGDTIKLTADITDAGQVDAVSSATATINKAVTIDGNSKTISAYKDGKVTKNITDKDGNVTATEQVDATFCFDVTTASGIQIKDLTINGASFNRKLGGAMYVETGVELTLNNVAFRNCAAGNTGAGNGGAAIYAESHKGTAPVVTANNCTFENNTVNGGNTGRGGAVYGRNANITLNNCTFTGNKAAYGGAVAAAGSTELTVKGCTFAANNDAVYGGDDIYIFDGYTFYKKTKAADSAVTAVLSGNTHEGNDGIDFKDYCVVCGRVLGDVTDTTSSAGNEIKGTYSGSGALFLFGHDLTFSSTDYDRKGAPVKESTGADYKYLLVNIPYAEFYRADLNNDKSVDAFTSATKNKTRTGSLAGGSYHVNADGTDITGVTFPVVMSQADFEKFKAGKTEITEKSSVKITVTNRGKTNTMTYTGKDALFESDSYAYYVLSEAPAFYKAATVDENGNAVFGKVQGMSAALNGVKVSLQTESRYGDYQLNLKDDSNTISGSTKVYGVILHTKEGSDYGLRHLENIWRGTELAFCTGFTTAVHGCDTSSAHYKAIMGQTITQITYLTDAGIYTIDTELYVPKKFSHTFSVADADIAAKTTEITASGFPLGYDAVFTVKDSSGEDVTANFTVTGTALTWDTPPKQGTYTLTESDGKGVYAPSSASFTLTTSAMPAAYDNSTLSLKAADNATAQELAGYLAAISSVKVGETTYSATSRGAVTVINENGFLDLTAKIGNAYVFADLAEGKTYEVTVIATGYSTELIFTVTIPETIYAYASLTYAEYWAAESAYLSGENMTASSEEADRTYTQGQNTYSEYDKGAFDAVTRATTNHGLHRGSFQQTVKITGSESKTYEPLYWTDGNNFAAADGQTYNKNEIGMTQYQITGIKHVPVAVPAANYQAFCQAYTVMQNGETLAGGYSEQQLKAYQEVACVTASTNGLKAAALSGSTWSFGTRKTGTESGILGQTLTAAENVTAAVKSSSQFGDFIRVDLTGDGYGALGSMMQTVVWKYYGDSETALATYGTKFAADNWMHKSMGIQLGLTESLRCQLPEGTDGTGKWMVTVYALGYEDYTVTVDVQPGDLHGSKALPMTVEQKTQLENLKDQAAALIPENYNADTASEALKTLKEHYDEAVALLNNENATCAEAEELINELPGLIASASAT